VNVRFTPKATELLRRRKMTWRAKRRHQCRRRRMCSLWVRGLRRFRVQPTRRAM